MPLLTTAAAVPAAPVVTVPTVTVAATACAAAASAASAASSASRVAATSGGYAACARMVSGFSSALRQRNVKRVLVMSVLRSLPLYTCTSALTSPGP